MSSAAQQFKPPSTLGWFAITAGVLAMILAGRTLFESHLPYDPLQSPFSGFIFYLTALPFCQYLGVLLATRVPAWKAMAVAAAASGVAYLAGVTITVALGPILVIEFSRIGAGLKPNLVLGMIVGPIAAGAAYGFVIDLLHARIIGYSTPSRRAWRWTHIAWGGAAATATFYVILCLGIPQSRSHLDFAGLLAHLKIDLLCAAIALPYFMAGLQLQWNDLCGFKPEVSASVGQGRFVAWTRMTLLVIGWGIILVVASRYVGSAVAMLRQ